MLVHWDGLFISTVAKIYILIRQYSKSPTQPVYHWFFQMTGLLRRKFFFNEPETQYVSIYLNEDLKAQMNIGTFSGHVVLNGTQSFILVTFKSNISNNEVHEPGDPRHTLLIYIGRYIRITSEKTQAYQSIKVWSQLMDLARACIER